MKYLWLTLLFFIVTYILPLGSRPMVRPDEFRYAEIPREMIESGNYVVPHLLDKRYFEKPVLGYWLTVGSFRVFGINKFALRLPSALGTGLAALMIFLLVYQTTRDKKLAALASMLFIASGIAIGVGTFAVLDSQTTGFITGILATSFLAVQETKFNRRRFLLLVLCGIFAGLAFLTKGFITWVVPGLSMVAFLIWQKRWKEFYLLPWIPAVVTLIIVAPWALAIHRAEPDYWRYFIVVEHFQRFLGTSRSQHPQPFWFFLPVLVVGILPAGFLAPPAIAIGRKNWANLLSKPLYQFCLCAVVLPFLLFSASSGKLPTYILPCFPPLAILGAGAIACYFNSSQQHKTFHWSINIWGGLLTFAGIVSLCLMNRKLLDFGDQQTAVICLSTIILICGVALLITVRQSWRTRLYLFFASIGLITILSGFAVTSRYLGDKVPKDMLHLFQKKLGFDPSTSVLVTRSYLMQSVAWVYHRTDVRLLKSFGELQYGDAEATKRGEPQAKITAEELMALLEKTDRPDVVVIIPANLIENLPKTPNRQECTIDDNVAILYPTPRTLSE